MDVDDDDEGTEGTAAARFVVVGVGTGGEDCS